MFSRTSSEFLALCQSQVAVLTQGMGAALSAVYLTEELVEGEKAKLIPIVVYPESTPTWDANGTERRLPEQLVNSDRIPRLLTSTPQLLPPALDDDQQVASSSEAYRKDELIGHQQQIVLPLIHDGAVLGLLVTAREDRGWSQAETATIERIARTLTSAYLIDRRREWLESQLTQQQIRYEQQRDRLDDLLHQFRNPLTALRTLGKLLAKRLMPGEKNHKTASSIVRESDRLQELLQEFDACLDMDLEVVHDEVTPLALPSTTQAEAYPVATREPQEEKYEQTPKIAESGQQTLSQILPLLPGKISTLEPFSVVDVLEPLLGSASAVAEERNLEIKTEILPDLPHARGNAKALREVLSNIIDNALKYTPAGGQIDIRVDTHHRIDRGKMVAIAVCDTGPGIPPQDREHLFERHFRGVQASTDIPGTGLGLAIAKELITQMEGDIEMFSPARKSWQDSNLDATSNKGRGTTFVIYLPTISASGGKTEGG